MDWAARRSLLLLAVFLPPYYIYKLTTAAFAVVAPEDVAEALYPVAALLRLHRAQVEPLPQLVPRRLERP